MLKEVKVQEALKAWNSESADVWEEVGGKITHLFDTKRYPHLEYENVYGRTVRNRTLHLLEQYESEDKKRSAKWEEKTQIALKISFVIICLNSM